MDLKTENNQDNTVLHETWIARVIDHDQAAFALLYDNLLGHAYGLALRILKNSSMAEEVVQDTFWQVWREAPRFDPARGPVKAWLLTIARSRALDKLRRLDTLEYQFEPESEMMMGNSEEFAPIDLLAAAQAGHRLHHALSQLDSEPRHLVSLAFFRGLSHDEIASVTGLPLGTVKSHIRRALLNLRQLLTTDATE